MLESRGRAGLTAGIDLGGTNIKTALVDPGGCIRFRDLRPTGSGGGVEAVVGNMVASVEAVARQGGVGVRDLVGVGVGTPAVTSARGVVILAPNLHWRAEDTRLVRASLGNDAGAIGAGLLPFGPTV